MIVRKHSLPLLRKIFLSDRICKQTNIHLSVFMCTHMGKRHQLLYGMCAQDTSTNVFLQFKARHSHTHTHSHNQTNIKYLPKTFLTRTCFFMLIHLCYVVVVVFVFLFVYFIRPQCTSGFGLCQIEPRSCLLLFPHILFLQLLIFYNKSIKNTYDVWFQRLHTIISHNNVVRTSKNLQYCDNIFNGRKALCRDFKRLTDY